MATPLTTGNSVTNTSQYATADIQPSAGALVLTFVVNVRPLVSLGTLATPTIVSNGLTWELVDTVLAADGERRLTCLRARGPAPVRGPLTIAFADQLQESCAWSVVEYTGVETSGLHGGGAIGLTQTANAAGTSLDATFTPADPTRDRTIGAIMLQQARAVSAGAGFTEIHEQGPVEPFGKSLTLHTQDCNPGTTRIGWTWAGGILTANALIIGIKSARPVGSTGVPTLDLIRRYEPILHLHPEESFVPVNAKRYAEASALWGAGAPFDDKSRWGTAPLIRPGQVSAALNEPGEYLGRPDYVASDANRERFLELGGWKDRNETREPGVTATSTNPYVDRVEILRRYGTDLADSKFWYHAEIFDTARLKALAGRTTGLNLTATLANFANPIMVCYYLFYPAHEQSVGKGSCTNVEAKEFACHAGDWHCVALLFDGAGPPSPETYTPRFFGITGSRPTPVVSGGVETFRPHAFDAERRMVVKVEPWRRGSASTPVQPELVGDHPRFYVARGSHSMYTKPGPHDVSPFEDARTPLGCGKFDTPSAVPPAVGSPGTSAAEDNSVEIVLVKMIAGAAWGPLGAIAGLFAGAAEAIASPTPFGVAAVPPPPPPPVDPANVDTAPTAAGQGLTVRPAAIPIPGVTQNLFDWQSKQNVQAGNRKYDFIVDRATQVWWPSDDGTAGFRGRWGQRVASDPVPHRAGVKFPEFWRMFLTALEQGFSEKTLARPQR